MTKYHVTPKWNGNDLKTAADYLGEEEAIEMFLEKWETDDVSFAADQVTKIYLYETLADAQSHQKSYGGEILEIDDEWLEIRIDEVEGYPTVRNSISKNDIKRVA